MARPERNDVDYFPFYCKEGKAMFIIESQYGNDGYATWVKLLRLLAVTNYHYLNLQTETEVLFIASKCKVSKETLLRIINTLVDIGEFDAELWEDKIIWSAKFIESIKDAYFKRGNKTMFREEFIGFITALGVRKPSKSTRKPTKDTILYNTILKDSKVDNTKVEVISKVFLTESEINSAREFFGQFYDIALETLSNYKNSSGKKYKSDYHTLRGWVAKEIQKSQPQSKIKQW